MHACSLRDLFGILLCAAIGAGCAAQTKGYSGPIRTKAEVGIVSPAVDAEFQLKYIAVLKIDGKEKLGEWIGGSASHVYLLPADYRFRVECRQFTQGTAIPIVDLVTMISDAVAAASHDECNIAFPVAPGFIHRIEYDIDKKKFFVAREPTSEPVTAKGLKPTSDAVECVAAPEKTAELWCALEP